MSLLGPSDKRKLRYSNTTPHRRSRPGRVPGSRGTARVREALMRAVDRAAFRRCLCRDVIRERSSRTQHREHNKLRALLPRYPEYIIAPCKSKNYRRLSSYPTARLPAAAAEARSLGVGAAMSKNAPPMVKFLRYPTGGCSNILEIELLSSSIEM